MFTKSVVWSCSAKMALIQIIWDFTLISNQDSSELFFFPRRQSLMFEDGGQKQLQSICQKHYHLTSKSFGTQEMIVWTNRLTQADDT